MKKFVTESDLSALSSRLKERLKESEQVADEGVMDNIAQGAKNAWNTVTSLGNQVPPKAGQGGTPTPVKQVAKSDPAVLARQNELIAAGAKIKADGIAGPATAAAEQQFGGQATVMAANAKDAAAAPAAADNSGAPPVTTAAASGTPVAPTAPAAPAAPTTTAGGTAADDSFLGKIKGMFAAKPAAPVANQADQIAAGNAAMAGAVPPTAAEAVPKPAAPVTAASTSPTADQASQIASAEKAVAPATAVKESTGYDEVQRLVSLVQFR